MKLNKKQAGVALTLAMLLLLGIGGFNLATANIAQADSPASVYFPETGHSVSGKFLAYWRNNGGLAVFGYPITDAQMEETPNTDGGVFLTQWFERNRFELHPENAGTKYEVELGLLGKDLNQNRLETDPNFLPTGPKPGLFYFFPQTKHNVGELFYRYWQNNGDLMRFGYPISEPHQEVNPETGKLYLTQWFERARFEYHPENAAPYNVLLGLLGSEIRTISPATLLEYYYNSVNGQDYRQAYNYWENPDTSYAQFVQGYADTAWVTLNTGTVIEDAGAGSIYGEVPVVLQAKHTDGTYLTFYGCYIVHGSNIEPGRPLDISNATIKQDSSGAAVPTLLAKAASICGS
jgi:hypothetical protein